MKKLGTQRIVLFVLMTLTAGLAMTAAAEPLILTAVAQEDRIQIFADGILFTEYRFRPEQKYPYFYPVNGPASSESVTTETSEPYPHHHSLFFGCDRVNGGNYWQDVNERGQIVSETVKCQQAKGDKIVITNQCLWKRSGAEPPFRDERTITITAPSESLRIIDFDVEVTALMDAHIEKTNHSLFSARMVPELAVTGGGTLVNANGDKSEKGTFGVKAPWCDYFGTRNGVTEGLAIFDHPANPWHPSKWFTRDYGFFSPTEMNWLEDGSVDLFKDEINRLRYRVVVHEGDVEKAEIAKLYQNWIQE
ncbi:MAG: PmoA family protein [Candidatus Omnitrophota bacterium]